MKFLGNEEKNYLILVDGNDYRKDPLEIPEMCEEIGPGAFYYIADNTYYGNSYIHNFEAPVNLKYIADQAFMKTGIQNVSFAAGSKIESIENGAFFDSALINIDLPEGIKRIDDPFRYAPLESLYIPSTLEIPESDLMGLFLQVYSLREINVAPAHPTYSSVDGILYSKDQSKLMRVPNALVTSTFTVPSIASTIGKYAIVYPQSDITIVIPSTVTEIESAAFRDGQQHIRQGELISDSRHIIGIEYQGSTTEWEAVTKSMERGYEWVSASDENGIQSLKFHTVECLDGSVELY